MFAQSPRKIHLVGSRNNMGQQPVKMRMRDGMGRMRIMDIPAAQMSGPLVIDNFGYAGGDPAAVFSIQRLMHGSWPSTGNPPV